MPHTRLTRLDGRPLAGKVCESPEAAWAWVAEVVAQNFDCLPEDVDLDEDDLVTVGGEAVARVDNTPIGCIVDTQH